MRARRKKSAKRTPISKTAIAQRARLIRRRIEAINGDFKATKSGHTVTLAVGQRVATVKCSSSPVAELFVASARRWHRFFPDLEAGEIAERAMLEVELGPQYIDGSVTFWRRARPDWSAAEVLERVAFDARAVTFAQRKRRFGSCFA